MAAASDYSKKNKNMAATSLESNIVLFSKLLLLPSELIESEILTRLPVKTLLRFRSVCKSWKMLISSNHDFINSHLVRNPNYDSLLVLSLHQTRRSIAYNAMFQKFIDIIGCINGLVCFCNWYEEEDSGRTVIAIWNPATKQCLKIKPDLPGGKRDDYSFFGFGYDSISNDYKIIHTPCDKDKPFVGDIYSCKGGGWTKTHPSNFLCHGGSILSAFQPVTINGTPYWLKANNSVLFVLSFDVRKEVFTLLPDVCTLDPKTFRRYVLMDLRDSLVVLVAAEWTKPFKSPIDVYVYNERCSVWDKTITMEPLFGQITSKEPAMSISYRADLLQCFRSGDILCISDDYLLYCFNLETHAIRRLKNLGNHPRNLCNLIWFACTYSESLIFIEGMEPLHEKEEKVGIFFISQQRLQDGS